MAGNVHVVPAGPDGWAVRIEGTDGTGPVYRSREEAILSATVAAKQARVDLIVHDGDGAIHQRSSFRGDSGIEP